MNNLADKFFESIKGKKVGFIGIGTSNLPLIKLFSDKGAVVSAYDKFDYAKEAINLGVEQYLTKPISNTAQSLFWARITSQNLTATLFSAVRAHRFTDLNLLH